MFNFRICFFYLKILKNTFRCSAVGCQKFPHFFYAIVLMAVAPPPLSEVFWQVGVVQTPPVQRGTHIPVCIKGFRQYFFDIS